MKQASGLKRVRGSRTDTIGSTCALLVFVLSLVGYPIVAALSVASGVENRVVTIPFRLLIILLCVAAFMFGRPTYRATQQSHFFWVIWWLFWFLYLTRIILDFAYTPEALKRPVEDYLLYSIGTALVPAITVAAWASRIAGNATLIPGLALIGSLGIAVNLALIAQQRGIGEILRLTGYRMETEALNPIALGHLGVLVFLLSVWYYFQSSRLKPVALVSAALVALIGLFAVVASGSRGPIMALLLSLLALQWLIGIRKNVRRFLVIGIIASLAVFHYADDLIVATEFLSWRLFEVGFEDHNRNVLHEAAIDLILKNPFTGGGTEPLEQYPHNLILESFLVFGVFSGSVFVLMLATACFTIFRFKTERPDAGWIYVLLVQNIAYGMVSNSLYFAGPLWMLMAACVSLVGERPTRRAGYMTGIAARRR